MLWMFGDDHLLCGVGHSTNVRLQHRALRTLCTVPVVASYVAWRADQVLYGSYTLDIDSDNVGLCISVQDRTLGGEANMVDLSSEN